MHIGRNNTETEHKIESKTYKTRKHHETPNLCPSRTNRRTLHKQFLPSCRTIHHSCDGTILRQCETIIAKGKRHKANSNETMRQQLEILYNNPNTNYITISMIVHSTKDRYFTPQFYLHFQTFYHHASNPCTSFRITFLTLFLKMCYLQGNVAKASTGSWFQSLMILSTKEYFLVSVLCFLAPVFQSSMLRWHGPSNLSPVAFLACSPEYALKRVQMCTIFLHCQAFPDGITDIIYILNQCLFSACTQL